MSGRRTHRTPETREAVLRLLRAGNTREDSARFVDMDPVTMRRWMHADASFRRAVEQAESQARVRAVTVVVDDAFGRPAVYDDRGNVIRAEVKPSVTSAMWYLERRDPLNWGRKVSVDIRATVERVAHETGLDPDEVMAEVERLYEEHAASFRRT
ncbi:MAG: hypothetical protein MUE82_06765 [Chloroflexi bacterium]|nr:hypothetical protein [Chloroflexota bacterium]